MRRIGEWYSKKQRELALVMRLAPMAMLLFSMTCACEYAKSQTREQCCEECASLNQATEQSIRAELSEKLRVQLREELREQLIAELRPQIEAEILQERDTLNKDESELNVADTSLPIEKQHVSEEGENFEKVQDEQEFLVNMQLLAPSGNIEKDDRGLKILRITMALGVERRQPIDERKVFKISDGAIFCYLEVASVYDDERMLTLRWTHTSGISQSYDLAIGQSPAWRTWSKLNLTQSMRGNWTCEVFNEDGVLLASSAFFVRSER
ncbi:MAG: DUF2914 domain-containing protein [Bradymonadales bacterium]